MQIRILVLMVQPAPVWQEVGPVDVPSWAQNEIRGGSEQWVDALFDLWLRQVRTQYPGVRVLGSIDGGDWREW